jgi:hypothetical protein
MHGNDWTEQYDKALKKACKDARIGLKHLHNFRRAAVMNIVLS